MRNKCPRVAAAILAWGTGAAAASAASLPRPVVPLNLGVNIHFTRPRPGEMRMLAASGVRWIRTDLAWAGTERSRGVYDFTAYDVLMRVLKRHHIRALFILDYGNALYTPRARFPATRRARRAFVRWAAAAVQHFRHDHVMWELYNEPNGMGHATPLAYARLAVRLGKVLPRADPTALYVGPALSGMHFKWLRPVLHRGALRYWRAVSVHPYRPVAPETVGHDYARLRALLRHFSGGKNVPILSGEWGYSSAWMHGNEKRQGRLLAREFITNMIYHVPLSIWYDWHDDGPRKNDSESNFGMVGYRYRGHQKWVYRPKPAFVACRTFTGLLAGYQFAHRLAISGKDNYAVLFRRGKSRRIVLWHAGKPDASGKKRYAAKLVLPKGRYQRMTCLGRPLPPLSASGRRLEVRLTTGPEYLY